MPAPANSPGDGRSAAPHEGRHLPVPAGAALDVAAEIEVVEARPIDNPPEAAVPTPLAAAAGGFAAGFFTVLLVRLLRAAPRRLFRARGRRVGEREITSTRSFLVDVHVLKR